MMESMSVRPILVSALAQEIRTGARGIRTQLDTLDGAVSKLRASWSGEAQTAYDQAQRDWNAKLSELQALLEQIATKTENMSQEYSAGDKKSAGRFLA